LQQDHISHKKKKKQKELHICRTVSLTLYHQCETVFGYSWLYSTTDGRTEDEL